MYFKLFIMIHLNLLLLLTISTWVTGSSYQPVSFIPKSIISDVQTATSYTSITVHNKPNFVLKPRTIITTPQRRLGLITYGNNNELWHEGAYLATSPINGARVEIGRGGHLTPDFSNGLEYPDPFLITGVAAQAIAKLLYSHELFYTDYPHVSALLRHQQIRRDNGLEGHKLGSIRPESPFFRYRFRYSYTR